MTALPFIGSAQEPVLAAAITTNKSDIPIDSIFFIMLSFYDVFDLSGLIATPLLILFMLLN
jgi:hypothetical protein